MVTKLMIIAIFLDCSFELFTGVVCKSHLRTEVVSDISERPVLLCRKTKKKIKNPKSREVKELSLV